MRIHIFSLLLPLPSFLAGAVPTMSPSNTNIATPGFQSSPLPIDFIPPTIAFIPPNVASLVTRDNGPAPYVDPNASAEEKLFVFLIGSIDWFGLMVKGADAGWAEMKCFVKKMKHQKC
jgi:hypothetical protein